MGRFGIRAPALSCLAAFALAACGGGDGGDGRPTRFRAAVAQVDITPPVGTILGGYGVPGQHRAMTGVHDALRGQAALVANDAGQAFLILSVDLAGYLWDFGDWGPGIKVLRESVAAALAPTVPLQPQHVLVASSHSHAAPDVSGFNQDVGQGPDKALLDALQRQLAEAAVAAAGALQDADLWHGMATLPGWSARDEDCSPVLDESVAVLQARDRAGKVIFTVANYAKHPTVLPESNRLASADFVWGYREAVEQATGAPALYLQGFAAAVHGKHSFDESPQAWDHAREVGEALAGAVTGAPLARAAEFDIRHRAATYACPSGDTFMAMALSTMDMPKRHVTTLPDDTYVVDEIEVSWHRVGPVEFVVFPGEPSPEYGVMAKARMVSPTRFAVGLGNDAIGYMVEPESMKNDAGGRLSGYENMMGLGSEAGPRAWAALESLGWFDGAWAAGEVAP